MNRLVPSLFLLISSCCFSCNNSNNNREEDPITDFDGTDIQGMFSEYRITAEEGDDNLTIFLQYRDGGKEGQTLVMDKFGMVELDGERIPVDSSGRSGAFYELHRPIASFTGKHEIVLTAGGEKYKETFYFESMRLKHELPDTLGREDMVLELQGLDELDHVRLVLTDTSYVNEGINRLDTLQNGRMFISRSDLDLLSNGEIQMELHRENEQLLKNNPGEGGISINFILKRKFILRDQGSGSR